jgi:hypothetical protein
MLESRPSFRLTSYWKRLWVLGVKPMLYTPRFSLAVPTGGVPCLSTITSKTLPFERTSKSRKGYPSETQVKRGSRVVHGDKHLVEKLGRQDPCPCGSGRRFQEVLPAEQAIPRLEPRRLLLGKRETPNMQFKSVAPRVAHSDRFHQRFALQRGRLTGCYASTQFFLKK